MTNQPTGQPSAGTLAIAASLVVVLVAGFIALSIAGKDTGTYTLFVAGPLVTTVVGAVLARRVAVTEQLARTAVEQTNGTMSAQFSDVHDHLDGQTGILLASLEPDPPAAVQARYKSGALESDRGPLPKQAAPSVRPDQAVHPETVRRLK